MSDTDLAERVCDLEERVAYLERELEMSVDEKRFRRKVRRLIPGKDYTIEQNGMGYKVEFETNPERLPSLANEVDRIDDVGWQVVDSSEDTVTVSVEEGLINR